MNWKLASFIQATEQRWGAKNQRVGCFSLIVVYKRLKWIGCVLRRLYWDAGFNL